MVDSVHVSTVRLGVLIFLKAEEKKIEFSFGWRKNSLAIFGS
jgi:hypothetical protein